MTSLGARPAFLTSAGFGAKNGLTLRTTGFAGLLQPAQNTRAYSCSRMSLAPVFDGRAVLLAKAAPDGSLGNCPFTQKANLALRLRGVPFDVETVNLSDKPEWFLQLNEAGTTPAFVDGDVLLKSSDDIVQHADKVGKAGPLLYENSNQFAERAKQCASPPFSAFAKLMKSKGDDTQLRVELTQALDAVANHLGELGTKFMTGDEISAVDCELAPKLWHIQVAGKHHKGVELPEALHQYLRDIESCGVWKATTCPDEVLIAGWGKYL